jgi:peptide deformylase
MEFTYYPDPILREKTKKVTVFDEKLAKAAEDMIDMMHIEKGIGLAGPQAALNQSIIVIEPEPGNIKVLINPEITHFIKDMALSEEGCLSFPQIYGLVARYKKVTVKYQDLAGNKKKIKAKDFLAYVLQHEIDHLNGIVFIDKLIEITAGENNLKDLLEKSGENIKLYE